MGYRKAIRNKIPETIRFALLYSGAQTAYIEHLYQKWIKHLIKYEDKAKTTKTLFKYCFHSTIVWDSLDEKEKAYWTNVEGWVKWFSKNFIYIHETYNMSIAKGMSEKVIARKIIDIHMCDVNETLKEGLAKYLIKCCKICKQK